MPFLGQRGGIESVITALMGLFAAMLVFWVVMIIWQPITSMGLFPLLNNTQAFPYGPTAVTLFNVFVLVAAVAILLAFFNEARGNSPPPMQYVQ